ncbi:MAG: hypothetical protein CME06_09080 [Gemmatimonadetes bacterium]|nr:hypothetical protein [Gemmatimonadota bacterium]
MQLNKATDVGARRPQRGDGTGRLTVRDVARRTGRSQKTVYRYIRSGKLNAELVTTPHGQLYLIDEKDVERAGLPLVQTTPSSEPSPSLVDPAGSVGDGALVRYLQNEIAGLKSETRRLRGELDRALYIIGVYRGRLEGIQRRLSSACRGRSRAERNLLQARNDADFYRSRATSDRSTDFWTSWIRRH